MAEKAHTYMDVGVRATQDAKAEFTGVNEHFEAIFNAAEATHDCMDAGVRATQEAKAEIVFQQAAMLVAAS